MALNGWSKIRKGVYGELWQKDRSFVKIIYHSELKLVNIYIINELAFEKEFSSKKEALAYAKSYMRKH